jgi:glycosyltransferase involved in cell wall biosynthesis/SAM-dependent methyltransferase
MPPGFLPKALVRFAQALRLEMSARVQRKGSLFFASRAVLKANLFDAQWYLKNNPDVRSADINPIYHYLLRGAYEGRSPHPLFDSAHYLEVNTDVAERRFNPLMHFIRSAQGTWRSPHRLFDVAYYLRQLSPDEQRAIANPLQHFLEHGAARGLDPHPFFSVTFYKDSCPDIDFSIINPLIHYLEIGAKEGRNPHPLFDDHFYRLQAGSEIGKDAIGIIHFMLEGARKGWSPHPWFDVLYYAKRYRDIQESGINPLWHYIIFGASELRDPCASFDAKYYYKNNSSALVKANPLIHFVTIGSVQGRRACANDAVAVPIAETGWKKFIPRIDSDTSLISSERPQQPITVVVRLERGRDSSTCALDSVLAASNITPSKVLIIHESGPNDKDLESLNSIRERGVLIELADVDSGLIAALIRANSLFPLSDIVLLDCSMRVTSGWIDKLVSHAYRQSDVGTVTPFSNQAGISGFPSLNGFRSYREWESLDMVDEACEQANHGQSVQIPVAVGRCIFIRHACLESIGLFEGKAFTERLCTAADFCVQASAQGWRHLLACDTFVFNEEDCDSAERGESADVDVCNASLTSRQQYEAIMVQHKKDNPALPFRVAALSILDAKNPLPTILFISHSLGGGTEKHLEELKDSLIGRIRAITLRPERQDDNCGGFLLQVFDGDRGPNLHVSDLIGRDFLPQFLSNLGINRIHVHHTIGSAYHLRSLIDGLALPYDITIHDYFTLCPQVNMITSEGNYCGEPEPDICSDCVLQRQSWGANDIHWWRLENQALIERAERVICPSEDVRERMSRYVAHANYIVVPHEQLEAASHDVTFPPLYSNEPVRVAILGAVSVAKGSRVLVELAKRVKNERRDIKLHVIGYIGRDGVDSFEDDVLTYTGIYHDETLLDSIKEYDPHLIFFPARWPETYSYTLSAALAYGAPIVAPSGGAFTERLSGRPLSALHDMRASTEELLQELSAMRDLLIEITATTPRSSRIFGGLFPNSLPSLGKQSDFYLNEYLEPLQQQCNQDIVNYRLGANGKLSVLVIPELNERGPTACSYIRLLLPLLAAQKQGQISVHAVSVASLFRSLADVLVMNRVAIESPEMVSKVLDYCRSNGIKVIYDIDDDLLQIEEHDESLRYAEKLPCILRMLIGADQVWASTPILASRLEGLSRECIVVPNGLDEKLWISRLDFSSAEINKKIRLVYMGTRTHDADLEMILPALERLRAKYGNSISLDIVGVVSRNDLVPSWAHQISIPFRISESYPLFVRWVRGLGRYDIGLAPLVKNRFNAGKSEIKLFDYAALGACVVASNHGGYSLTGVDGANCLFADDSHESWFEKMDALIQEPVLRSQLQNGAQNLLLSSGLNRAHLSTRLTALNGVVDKKIKSVVPAPLYLTQSCEKSSNTCEKSSNSTPIVLNLGKNRFRLILSHSFIKGRGIEVGALQNPLPVSEATQVRYVDRLSKEDLYRHYPELMQYNLVDPDILDNGEDLSTLADCSQDFVIANHFLEHCENTLKALRSFARVLRPGGRVFIALPDKRFTFDQNREVTTLAHSIADYAYGAAISRRVHFQEWASLVEPFFGRCYKSGEEMEARTDQLMKEDYSIHFHCWTPNEVHELLEYAIDKLCFPFAVEYFLSTEEEMILILRRTEESYSETLSPEALGALQDESSVTQTPEAIGT